MPNDSRPVQWCGNPMTYTNAPERGAKRRESARERREVEAGTPTPLERERERGRGWGRGQPKKNLIKFFGRGKYCAAGIAN
jgi:hypothetical protein